MKQVVVIGSSEPTGFEEQARVIGMHIARRGYVLISGGRGGIMEAASRGASECGGTVVGILPWESFDGANANCSIVIPTGIGFARNSMNILAADVVVALCGAGGTLSELAYAWIYKKPVVCCAFSGGWSEIYSAAPEEARRGSLVYRADNPDEACELIDRLLR